ncbi:MAG: DUF222 domain-containing protein [Acidobacteria bacterium]|nr:DUF222 domain-containing protein [Acidobacteriota bacterium]
MGQGDPLELAIRTLETEDLESLSPEDLGEDLIRLEDISRSFEAERARRLGVFDERKGHVLFDHPSTVSFLRHNARMSGSRANRLVSMARMARKFRSTYLSGKYGQISTDQAHQLFRAAGQMPDKYPDAEPVLLEIVGDTLEETRQILDYWRHSVDKAGVVIAEELQLERRRLDVSRKANGMVSGSFEMTTLAGETLMTALDALLSPPGEDDNRTPSQRRHDAMEDLTRSYLEDTKTSDVGGEKPHLNIHVDLDALQGLAGGLHETETGQVLTVDAVRQLACDSSLHRIVLEGESEVLDVGRKTRVIPTALRRAVIARDRHCTHQGCDRPARWCDVHHKIHWADGGETCLENLRLLCRFHHSLTHQDTEELVEARSI